MRIKKIQLNKIDTQEVGLEEIDLDRLGSLVTFVGKNGSGKSRILNLIESRIESIVSIENIIKGNVTHLPKHISQVLKEIEPNKKLALAIFEMQENNRLLQANPTDTVLKARKNELRQIIVTFEKELQPSQNVANRQVVTGVQQRLNESPSSRMKKLFEELQPSISKLKKDYIKRVHYNQIRDLRDVIEDADSEADSFEQLVESVTEQLEYNELGSLFKSSLKFLKKLPNQLVSDWMECKGDKDKFERRKSRARFQSLKDIFERIFEKSFDWEIKTISKSITDKGVESLQHGIWKINKREFNYSEFSDGEKTLFAYALLFFLMSQNTSIRLKDSIMIIDEPELHLHPDAEIELLSGIRDIVSETGQLFIATHSLNILANINYDEVFMVKNGFIKNPSCSIQSEALSELMKIEERIYTLTNFLSSISDWTYVRFMAECFTSPEVIEVANMNDPQVRSLKDIINKVDKDKKSFLLDFGAGKGRLYEHTMKDVLISEKVNYFALEPNEEFHSDLKSKGIKKVYSSHEQLSENSFDFVVLCNVLHEMEIDEWIPTLNKIISSLTEHGYLIIIEAKYLRKGERIGKHGYLLLDEQELQVLFDLKQSPTSLHHDEVSKKVTTVLIGKSQLKPVTQEKLMETLKALESNTFKKIIELRESDNFNDSNNTRGRLSAFLAQLNINARIAQDQLNKKI